VKRTSCIDPWSKSASGTAPSCCSAIVPSGSGSQIASTFPAGLELEPGRDNPHAGRLAVEFAGHLARMNDT
jgi:hypothetical protein